MCWRTRFSFAGSIISLRGTLAQAAYIHQRHSAARGVGGACCMAELVQLRRIRPSSPEQTYTVWAVSTLIFILTVTLGFMLVRNFVKLYVDHRRNREGSRIRTKLVLGALALTFTPVVFLVFFSIGVLNINLRRWFTQPAENVKTQFHRDRPQRSNARTDPRRKLWQCGSLNRRSRPSASEHAQSICERLASDAESQNFAWSP